MRLLEKAVRTFKHGIIDEIEAQSIPDGAASASLNWQTKGDKIELRRGYKLLGSDAGTGKVTGLVVGTKQDGTEVLFKSYGRQLQYLDETLNDWANTGGTDPLPDTADGDDVSFSPYNSLSGAAVYLSSKNSGMYKIMTANPANLIDLQSSSYRGKIKIRNGRTYLWDRTDASRGKDETGLYRSKIDRDEVSDYTAVTAENRHDGDGATKTFSGTLSFKATNPKNSCFLVRIYSGTETFYDDKNGGLSSDLGGTGTINYATGDYTVTFFLAPTAAVNRVKADYYHEDPTTDGVADFSFSATRTAGQGYVLRQDDGGGKFQNVGFYNSEAFCFHERKTWKVTESSDDLSATNLIYRELVGIPNWRAVAETGEGIYYIDDHDSNAIRLRLLTLEPVSSQVVPVSISDNLKLSDYLFDQAVGVAFADFVLFACRTSDSPVNNAVIVYDRRLKTLDKLDYYVSCFAIYGGALVAGDSMSNNVYELFSGFDDQDADIPNYWEGNISRLGVDELKKVKRLRLQGEIAPDQEYEVWLSLDKADFVYIGTISGSGSYVDRTSVAQVGTETIGTNPVGGGGGGVTAYNYFTQLSIRQDKFDEAKIRFVATGLGYVSISMYDFFDIRPMGQRVPRRYR